MESLVADKIEFVDQITQVIKQCDLLVNTTPVGMKDGQGSPIEKKLLHKGLSVYDVIYNRRTQLIEDAESLGIPVSDGLGMLLYQGVLAWQIWTNQEAPVDVMKQALLAKLGRV